jgi:hypothetical protein
MPTVEAQISIAFTREWLNSMKRHPNIAFFGGTVVIALMVLAAFSTWPWPVAALEAVKATRSVRSRLSKSRTATLTLSCCCSLKAD